MHEKWAQFWIGKSHDFHQSRVVVSSCKGQHTRCGLSCETTILSITIIIFSLVLSIKGVNMEYLITNKSNERRPKTNQSQRVQSWWRHQMETFSTLLAICAGKSPVPGEFPAQRPVTRSFGVFFDLRPNKRLSKQWWGWWFETPLRSLWHHCNVVKRLHMWWSREIRYHHFKSHVLQHNIFYFRMAIPSMLWMKISDMHIFNVKCIYVKKVRNYFNLYHDKILVQK